MKCEQVQQLIPDWLDGEAEAFQAEAIEKHIDKCQPCRDEASFWQAVGSTLREETENIKAPPGFAAGVMAQLPQQQETGFGRLAARWKRSIAAAAAFLLLAAGAAGGYLQWGLNTLPRVAQNEKLPGIVTEHNPAQNDPIAVAPDPQEGSGEKGPANEQNEQGVAGPDNDGTQETDNTGSNGKKPDPAANSGNTKAGASGNPEVEPGANTAPAQYVWLNDNVDRVLERTFLRLAVDDFTAAHNQAVAYLNSTGAQYEILGSENTVSGNQESLKIVVDSKLSSALVKNLKTLGQVVTADSQRNDITGRYNENVEQYRSLEAQLASTESAAEREQLQVKMAGIEAQLKAWDKEARTDTIILWLES